MPLLPATNVPPSDEPAAPVPSEPPPLSPGESPRERWWHGLLGFAVLVCCFEAGDELKHCLGLILPGNILGLFLLLALLGSGVLPERYVLSAARWLLWLLPLLFMPIFVHALHNPEFWLADRGKFAAVVAAGTLLLWAATGHLAQWTLRKRAAATEIRRQ